MVDHISFCYRWFCLE